MTPKTAALLVGFGGPTHPSEVRPFIESVLNGAPVSPGRIDEVARHYEAFGGVSPYNAEVFKLRAALERRLRAAGRPLWVGAGFRHSKPSFHDAFQIFRRLGIERVVGFVLSGFRSEASFDRYLARVDEGRRSADAETIAFEPASDFFEDPLFIRAQAARVKEIFSDLDEEEKRRTFVLFSAHSIPIPMAVQSGYDTQFIRHSALVAHELNLGANWQIAYQSRSGAPRDPWLVPSVEDVLRAIDRAHYRRVAFAPNGFLCENIEILYDLDTAARALCENLGLEYRRAPVVGDHPAFVELMEKKILEQI